MGRRHVVSLLRSQPKQNMPALWPLAVYPQGEQVKSEPAAPVLRLVPSLPEEPPVPAPPVVAREQTKEERMAALAERVRAAQVALDMQLLSRLAEECLGMGMLRTALRACLETLPGEVLFPGIVAELFHKFVQRQMRDDVRQLLLLEGWSCATPAYDALAETYLRAPDLELFCRLVGKRGCSPVFLAQALYKFQLGDSFAAVAALAQQTDSVAYRGRARVPDGSLLSLQIAAQAEAPLARGFWRELWARLRNFL